MKMPIFIFTDDLDIFRSLKAAECYLESWMVGRKIEGFDSAGKVLTASVELRRVKKLFGLLPVTLETIVISENESIALDR